MSPLTDPRLIDRIVHVWGGEVREALSIGHGLRLTDQNGVKMIPTGEVFVRIDMADGAQAEFSVGPRMADDLAVSLNTCARLARERTIEVSDA